MKTTFFLLIMFFLNLSTYSQKNQAEAKSQRAQSVFIELGGNGIIFSGNYDLRFAKKQNGLGARIGLGYITDFLDPVGGLSIPIGINYLAGKGNHHLEAGVGATIFTLKGLTLFEEDANVGGVVFVPSLGYRYQPLQNGFTFRIFASPLIGDGAIFWAGLSAGYKF